MSKMNAEELKTMIGDAAREAAAESAKEYAQELEKKQTNWFNEIRSQVGPANGDVEKDRSKLGYGAARMIRALAASGGDPERASRWAERALNETWKDDLGEQVHKALAAGDLEAGGFMIPEQMSDEIIEFLYNRAVVRRAGPEVLPMSNGSLTLPKQTGSATASYVGENADISASEPSGGQIIMTAKKLAALVPISNDLLRFQVGDRADRMVRNDLVKRLAVREDKAFLRDDGTQNTPKGMRHWVDGGNIFNSNGTSSANVEDDVETALTNLEANNIPLEDTVWFMAPRSKNYLMFLRDATSGELIFPEMRGPNPMLAGRPVFTSNNIPTTLGSGSNESEVYLVDISAAIIAEAGGLEIEVNTGASYTDSGSLVSGFERDQTLIRAIELHDFAMKYDEAVTIIDQVTWGA